MTRLFIEQLGYTGSVKQVSRAFQRKTELLLLTILRCSGSVATSKNPELIGDTALPPLVPDQ